METAVTALIVIGVMILAIIGLSDRALSAQAALTDASLALQEREGERLRTILTSKGAVVDGTGAIVQVTIHNAGATKLVDFDRWDAIVEYSDGSNQQLMWLPYGVAENQWSAEIYQDADTSTPEMYDPNLLNPGEDLVVTMTLTPTVGIGSVNRFTLVTANGISAATPFTR